jgi:hypothetical protein
MAHASGGGAHFTLEARQRGTHERVAVLHVHEVVERSAHARHGLCGAIDAGCGVCLVLDENGGEAVIVTGLKEAAVGEATLRAAARQAAHTVSCGRALEASASMLGF